MSKKFHTAVLFGTFDILHGGHHFLLKNATEIAQNITVVVSPDAVVLKYKGQKPIQSMSDRVSYLKKAYPNFIVLEGDLEEGSWGSISKITTDVFILGYDQQMLKQALQESFPQVPQILIEPYKGDELHSSLLRKRIHSKKQERTGELYILAETILWAFFPIVTTLAYNSMPPLLTLAWSTLFSGLFFVPLILYRKSWSELKDRNLWRYVAGIVLFIGVLFYGLYFIGLESTTPGNASILAVFEVFTSFVFFVSFRKENFSREYSVGALLMILGAVIVLLPNFSGFNKGDFLILLATFCAPLGNLFQQKAKTVASSEIILFLRNTLSALVLFGISLVLGHTQQSEPFLKSLPFLLLNGFCILGLSKLFWIEGISRISVTKASALSSTAPFLTLIAAWVIFKQAPTVFQVTALVPLALGVLFLTDGIKIQPAKKI